MFWNIVGMVGVLAVVHYRHKVVAAVDIFQDGVEFNRARMKLKDPRTNLMDAAKARITEAEKVGEILWEIKEITDDNTGR